MNKKLTAAAILAAMTLAVSASAFAATPEDEIKDLKQRLAALEAKLSTVEKTQASAPKTTPNITITGESRIRYQSADKDALDKINGTNAWDLRQRLLLSAKINDHVKYNARLEATFQNGKKDTGTNTTRFNQNYFTISDVAGIDTTLIGRVPATAGMNLNVGKPSDNDGVIFVKKVENTTFTAFSLEEDLNTHFDGLYADLAMGKNANLALGYTKGDKVSGTVPEAKSFDVGAYTKLGKDLSLVGQYVDTSNGGGIDDADAWAVQLVKGVTTKKVGTLSTNMTIVDKSKPHTDGYILSYRRVEKNGLWNQGVASPFSSNNSVVTNTDDVKGVYFGYQNVLAKNTILTLEYQDLKSVDTGAEKDKIFQTHVQFFF
ncbi:MAG: hypothetical protein AAGU32_12895 [Bacillota bacterium]